MFTIRLGAVSFVIVLGLSLLGVGITNSGENEGTGAKKAEDKTSKPGNKKPEPGPEKTQPDPVDPKRKIIYTVEVEFEVESIAESAKSVEAVLKKHKNSFRQSEGTTQENSITRRFVVVRVPRLFLDAFLGDLRTDGALGSLKTQRVSNQDVTKQYTDIEGERRAIGAVPERLLEIIKTGKGTVKELVAAESELGNWRTRIERLDGEIRNYNGQIAFSSVTINLIETEKLDTNKKDDPAKPYLEMLASEKNPVIRKRLVIALMNLGAEAASAVPTFFSLSEEKNVEIRKAAQTAIMKLKPIDVVDALASSLRKTDLDTAERRICCKFLAFYYAHPDIDGEKRKDIYRALEETLADPDDGVRLAAALALDAIAGKSSKSD